MPAAAFFLGWWLCVLPSTAEGAGAEAPAAPSPATRGPAAAGAERERLARLKALYGIKGPLDLAQAEGLVLFDANLRELEGIQELKARLLEDTRRRQARAVPPGDTLAAEPAFQSATAVRRQLRSQVAALKECVQERYEKGEPLACSLGPSAEAVGHGSIAVGDGARAYHGALAHGPEAVACGRGARAFHFAVAVGDRAYAQGEEGSTYVAVGASSSARPDNRRRRHLRGGDPAGAIGRHCRGMPG